MNKRARELSFFGHLDELRARLVKSVIAIVICSCLFCLIIDKVLFAITRPVGQLVFTSPADAFLARFLLILLGGFLLSLPYVLCQIWSFVGCALKENERKYVTMFAPFSFILFFIGGMFAYYVMIPISLKFFLGFSSDFIVPMITINNYIAFVGTLVLAFGITFELPLVLVFLAKIGVATPEFLMQKRKHAIILILIISALITPSDLITMFIMAGPLIILYEIGIMATKLTFKEKETV